VRDLLLHRVHNDPWRGLPDLDLVVQGRASELVKELVDALAGQLGEGVVQRCQEHGAYGTVELELNLDGQQVLLDVATARCETYPVPAENPQVSFGSLADDLARRDFSINAMALDLVSGTLLDPHGGQADLELRQLRFLHHGSVRDDPTRLVRGARYAARLGLELDGASADQAAATLAQWPWPWRQGDAPAEAPSACWSASPGWQLWGHCSAGALWRCLIRSCRRIRSGRGGCAGLLGWGCRCWWPWWRERANPSPWRSGCSCPTASTAC
jgi:poly(A) polymerase